jgi:glycogen operon protein
LGTGNLLGELARRMTASADQFNHDNRTPRSSINHVTVHDGFTLADLTSYGVKHNEANGEDNRDGSDDNQSNNWGVEGHTDDAAIVAIRRRQRKNMLACLMLAQGTPLLLAGDEVGNGQGGNNNAYCQDNEVGWIDWSRAGGEDDLTDFIANLTNARRKYPQLRTRQWVEGRRPDGTYGVLWLTPQATEMTEVDWNFPEGRFLAYVIGSAHVSEPPLYVVLNAAAEPIEISFPVMPEIGRWSRIIDTSVTTNETNDFIAGAKTQSPARSVIVFAGGA